MPPARRKPPVKPAKGGTASVDEPLEFLRGITFRQRQVCLVLERFETGHASAKEIIGACEYLSVEYPLHLFDVSDDLAPLLLDRCKPSDNIAPVLEELDEAQQTVRVLASRTVRSLITHLEHMSEGSRTKTLRRQSRELLAGLRRLSAIESGIVFPLARVRLGKEDLEELARRMRERRGLKDVH